MGILHRRRVVRGGGAGTGRDASARAVEEVGGRALIVGGYARDEIMRRFGMATAGSKDIDLEVYGLSFATLLEALKPFGSLDLVGESFKVIKLGNLDISIPRRDSKTGQRHKDFIVEGDPTMSVREAARRRDLTINALALNPLTGEIIDEWGGIEDLKNGILRATDLKLFGDDPLRVLRLMQFAGRFGFRVEEETAKVARSLSLEHLPAERITEEWKKLLLKSKRPSVGLEVARQLGINKKLHPELLALEGVPQEPEWHPEGDVWVHTDMVVDAAAAIVRREGFLDKKESEEEQKAAENEALVIMLGALCHDLGKAVSTQIEGGRWRSKKHASMGIDPARSFLSKFTFSKDITDKIYHIIEDHLFPSLQRDTSDASVRRLANRLRPSSIYELVLVAEADHRGRALPWDGFPEGRELIEKAEKLNIVDKQPKKILMGRHLIEMGLTPGTKFGTILDAAYEAQLDGSIKTLEEAKDFAERFL